MHHIVKVWCVAMTHFINHSLSSKHTGPSINISHQYFGPLRTSRVVLCCLCRFFETQTWLCYLKSCLCNTLISLMFSVDGLMTKHQSLFPGPDSPLWRTSVIIYLTEGCLCSNLQETRGFFSEVLFIAQLHQPRYIIHSRPSGNWKRTTLH